MNADQIYSRFVDEWNAIPNEVITIFILHSKPDLKSAKGEKEKVSMDIGWK